MSTTTEVTGKSYKILNNASTGEWHKISFWKKAVDIFFNSGKNAQTTLGSITGITSSLTSTSTTTIASAYAVKQLNDKITALQS